MKKHLDEKCPTENLPIQILLQDNCHKSLLHIIYENKNLPIKNGYNKTCINKNVLSEYFINDNLSNDIIHK